MKKISKVVVAGVILLITNIYAFAQTTLGAEKTSVIEPYKLAVTFYKTTNLLFPYAIKSVDRGSKDILVQIARGVDNILQLKAAKSNFDETNLTVVTADGKLYSYIVTYTKTPSVLNIRFEDNKEKQTNVLLPVTTPNEAQIQKDAESILKAERNLRALKDRNFGIKLELDGLYINNDVMYYRVKVKNQTNINYHIEQLRLFIRDLRKSNRTAAQELEVLPVYIQDNTSVVAGQSEHVFVFAIPKLTIPDKKYLTLVLMEKNGGRNLQLMIHNKNLIKAALLY